MAGPALEGGGAGDEDIGTGGDGPGGAHQIDPAVHLQADVLAGLVDHLADRLDLAQLALDEALPAEAGADTITVHPEAGAHLHRTIQRIKALGKRAGVSLNPATPAKMLDYVLEEIDLVLVMSVNPGFGGQSFIESQLRKIEAIRKMIDKAGLTIDLEVDGGIDHHTAPRAIAAGADALVAGTATFRGGPAAYAANIAALRGG